MALTDIDDLPATGALIGIDPGTKTLGIAATDALRLIASPVTTIRRTKLAADLSALFELYDQRNAAALIVGLPLNMDGSEGPRAQSARAFVRNVLKARDIPIALQDERLSSAEAERAMLEADLSRARRAELIDASAAAVILRAAIERFG
ncbi:MAG: Holliday junction resolvase RuvX [Pseudomonadota bacterium]